MPSITSTPGPEPLLLRLPVAAQMLGISVRTIYILSAQGHLRIRHIGRSSRIALADLRRYADSLSGTEARP